ncbi:hypothetical protein [Methylobacterium sp. GC_Met_2]|uniref:hypothetical protein n=1 Tax=Methylobacterium sp. GC_Met_2 TaxID=2937376 RepID=UPI00226BA716|nr:hypothetical protein [Methylobacterium sp. GC_Met_2]
MNAPVYHFTDTARLPHILFSGELRAGRNQIGGFPDPDFLWATTSATGDRTASASMPALREGRVRLVRFTLAAQDFEPWDTIVSRVPAWTPNHVERLERAAIGKSRPQDWRCRLAPLPADQWVGIETRSYTDKVWRPLPTPWSVIPLDAQSYAVQIGAKVYASTAVPGPHGMAAYVPTVLNAEDAA